MLQLNKTLQYIRNSRYEYLVKRGSISNYSFHIKDDDKTGILEVLFEEVEYPISEEQLKELLLSKGNQIELEKIEEVLNQLKDVEILYELGYAGEEKLSLCVISGAEQINIIKKVLDNEYYAVDYYSLENLTDLEIAYLDLYDEEQAGEIFAKYDFVLYFSHFFSPSTHYQLNKICLEQNTKLIIAYLDGYEGIIIPLLNFEQVGCYNDFEILRESSFYNLLDYQVMKEHLSEKDVTDQQMNRLHFNLLVNQTILLLERFSRYTSINYYAYSLDFERMVYTKTRLLKFPKCPSCQGDKNLVHPFL